MRKLLMLIIRLQQANHIKPTKMKKIYLLLLMCGFSFYGYGQELSKAAKEKIMLNNIIILSKDEINVDIADLSLSDIIGKKVYTKSYDYKENFGRMVIQSYCQTDTLISCSYDATTGEYRIGKARFRGDWRDSLVIGSKVYVVPKNNKSTEIRCYNADGSLADMDRINKVKFDSQGRIIEYNGSSITYSSNNTISSTAYSFKGTNRGVPITTYDNTKYTWQANKLINIEDLHQSTEIYDSKIRYTDNSKTTYFFDTDSIGENGRWAKRTKYVKDANFEGGKKLLSTTTRHFISLEEEARLKRLEQEQIAEERRIAEEKRQEEIRQRKEEQRLAEEKRQEEIRKREEERKIANQLRQELINLNEKAQSNHKSLTQQYYKDNALGKSLLGNDLVSSSVKKPKIFTAYQIVFNSLNRNDATNLKDIVEVQRIVSQLLDK